MSTEDRNIEGSVVQVLEEDQLVINRGRDDGVKFGDKFLVYFVGPNLTDPETNEDLGPLEIVRGSGVVTHIQNRIATIMSDNFLPIQKTFKRGLFSALPEEVVESPRERLPFRKPKRGDRVKLMQK